MIMNQEIQITMGIEVFLMICLYGLAILFLLYRIGSAIYEQTEWLKDADEIENIGS